MKQINFKPRRNLILARPLTTITEKDEVTGSVSNPTIIEAGTEVPVKNWVVIVRSNPLIPDLKEGDVVFFSGKGEELSYDGKLFYLVRDEDCFGTDEAMSTPA